MDHQQGDFMKNTFVHILFVASLVTSLATQAIAAAPMSKAELPAVRRIHVGAFEVTALNDGTIDLPMDKLLMNVKPQEFKKATEAAFMPMPFETSVNAFLVNTGEALVLVDSGAGTLFGPTVGKMLNNFKASGYQPDQVDAVLITHMHPDHVGGLAADGKMVFPKATVYIDQKESDFWLSDDNYAKAPKEAKSFFEGARASLAPYKAAGKLKAVPEDGKILTGITAKATHGHTAGHMNYVLTSNNQKLVFIGDLVHVGSVQFPNPSVVIQFDTDNKAAEKMRKAAFAEAAKEGYLIAAPHLSFPGMGHVRAEKKGYTFVPVNFTR
jgi:glyoxylase-like metal-dependent hydrolase (beta-lactamase superfamily II)